MTASGGSVIPTIASDEDMDWGYVLVSDATGESDAERVLREQALSQWGYRLGDVELERRQWFKPAEADGADEGDLERCAADDPARDSEWWVFDMSLGEHELLTDYGGRDVA